MQIALLMFNYNENESVIRNIELLKDIVNEILIVDSSDNDNFNYLKNKDANFNKFRIMGVFPIGYLEPFRMFAIKYCVFCKVKKGILDEEDSVYY